VATLTIDDAPPFTPIINMIAAPLGAGLTFVLQEGSINGASFSRLVQPQLEGSVTDRTPSANDLNEATLGTLANLVGLVVINAPYAFDGTNYLRMSGGLASVANPTLTAVAAQDVRAFLYAVDDATPAQAVRLRGTAAGLLQVDTTGGVPGTITTVADIAMVAATNTSIAAVTLARKQVIIQNTSSTAVEVVRIGDTNITGTRGTRLGAGESITLAVTAEVFGRPESGTPSLAITELED